MKLNVELKPCPFCGGKPEFKHKKRKVVLTFGNKSGYPTEERYIRCSKCHARTRSVGKIDNAVNLWNLGNVYETQQEALKL